MAGSVEGQVNNGGRDVLKGYRDTLFAILFGNTSDYPVILRPFEENGLTDCSYTKSSATDPGEITCAGVHGLCSVDYQPRQCTSEGTEGVWANQASCTFVE